MFVFQTKKSKKYLAQLAVASAISVLTGCGSSSSTDETSTNESTNNTGNTVDTRGLTDQRLREDLIAGMTQGVAASSKAVSTVLEDSKVLTQLSTQAGSGNNSSGRAARSTNKDPLDAVNTVLDESLKSFTSLINETSISQNGNVYTFNPNETQFCADPDSTLQEVADCQTVLSHITFVVTVEKIENDKVTAATTAFKYDNALISTVGFTANSGYYQFQLAGLRDLLTGFNEVATAEDTIELPSVMQGSIRVTSIIDNENSGSVSVSIPSSINLSDNSAGNEMQINMAATDNLLSISADGAAKTMEVEVGLGALDLQITDKDDFGNSLPLQLISSAITGKMVLSNNGNKLSLTGISADSVKFKVDNRDAITLGLASYDSVLDTSGNSLVSTLGKDFNFNFFMQNIHHYFNADTSENSGFSMNISAASGTTLTEVHDDMIKVTNGTVNIVVDEIGEGRIDISVPNGSCLDTSDSVAAVDCPAGS